MTEVDYTVGQRKRLKEIRSMLNYSQAQFAKELPYSLSSIAAIEAGNQKMPISLAYLMQDNIVQDAYGRCRILTPDAPQRQEESSFRAEWLFRGKGTPFENFAFGLNQEKCNIKIYETSTNYLLPTGESVLYYEMNDDTMTPEFRKKDIVAVDSKKLNVVSGRYYLIKLYDEKLIRQVFKVDQERYMVKALQEEIMPRIVIDIDKVLILGEYIYSIRRA